MLGCWGENFEVQVSTRLLGVKGYRYNSMPGSCEKFEVQLSARLLR